jgi:serine/threonine protein kinase/tetratricopeptide (TPR) repeat protein
VEDYLTRYPHLRDDRESVLDLIYHEIVLRQKRNEAPELEEYRDRFPQLEAQIAVLFQVHDLIRPGLHVKSPTLVDAPATFTGGLPVLAPSSWPTLADYEIIREVGRGGMGIVYEAFDRKRKERVALKTLQQVHPTLLSRFKREYRALADVAHPNLVTLHELDTTGTPWFFTMEFVEGRDFLSYVIGSEAGAIRQSADTVRASAAPPVLTEPQTTEACQPRALTSEQVARLRQALRPLAEALVALHKAGKLHRDMKPSNVLVTRSGRVVLLDFGLVADLNESGRHESTERHFLGTVPYMSPEQGATEEVGTASDWYSIGVMLYEALTGRLPFQGSFFKVIQEKMDHEAPPPREILPEVPDDLNALCVELLRRDQRERPSGESVLQRLGGPLADAGAAGSGSATEWPEAPLLGRERHLAALAEALETTRRKRTVAVFVSGHSGMGKSALVQHFLDQLAKSSEVVILRGRCYERESVPYKAFDSLVDDLSRYLLRLPVLEVQALLPRSVLPLTRVFPVLQRVPAVAQAPRVGGEPPDAQELRRQAFEGLRELLARLGDRKLLVLFIDDLQWGDVDSAVLLNELLRPPESPALLLLGCYRSEDAATSPFLFRLLLDRNNENTTLDWRELTVDVLTADASRDLVLRLLGDSEPAARTQAEAIARESAGNPFFVSELVQYARECGRSAGDRASVDLDLDKVLWARIQRLPDEARRLLEVVAVAGRPLPRVAAIRATVMGPDEQGSLAVLRRARLIRSPGLATVDAIETYHDRIRETVTAHQSLSELRDCHGRLASALEATGQADPEVLAIHFQHAGEADQAGKYFARAAEQASDALAFDRAVKLYQQVLELRPARGEEGRQVRIQLADALANAGRGFEAGQQYLAAAVGVPAGDATDLQRRAALQFLISGHVEEGLATLRTVLGAVGMTLPTTPRRALLSLILRRLRLRLRGLHFTAQIPDQVAPEDLQRIDICWSVAAGLGAWDLIRAADFQVRGLLLALRAGEPYRIVRSLATVAAHRAATAGDLCRPDTDRFLRIAEDLARQTQHPHALGAVALAKGEAAYFAGRWKDATTFCDQAEVIFRNRCTGVTWECNTALMYSLWALYCAGEVAEAVRRSAVLRQQALERGDHYATMTLGIGVGVLARLAADDPDGARRELQQLVEQWTYQPYYVQHYTALLAQIGVELYFGNAEAAWKLIEERWPSARQALLLMRIQFVRIFMLHLRTRCALAAAAASTRPESFLRIAERDARRMDSEKAPWASALARFVRAGVAAGRGDRARAVKLLEEAKALLEAVDMRLWARVALRRRGLLLGGAEGKALVVEADEWMRAQKIQHPERFTAMLAPGFGDSRPALSAFGA